MSSLRATAEWLRDFSLQVDTQAAALNRYGAQKIVVGTDKAMARARKELTRWKAGLDKATEKELERLGAFVAREK